MRVPGFASSFFLQLLLLQTGYTVVGQQSQLFFGGVLTGDTVVVVVVARHFSWQ